MTDKTAIITGANTGLGFECARAVLESDPGWHVVLAVRDSVRGNDAAGRLGHPGRTTVSELDLASLRSVRNFADGLPELDVPPLNALVCNAGLQMVAGAHTTADGYEMTFGVNHLGHFALVQNVIQALAAPARIVVVSSGTHDPDKFTGMPAPRYTCADELLHPPPGGLTGDEGRRRYTTSKLCNMLFSYELDRRLGHGARGITVNAFDPGLMPGSGLARDYSRGQRLAWRLLMPALRILPNVNSPRRSGANLAALVVDPALDGVTGAYFEGARRIRSSRDSYDAALAADLWRVSERLVALDR
ncbi:MULTISPECIES: SDR family NAD(P)-dependent oxidoreductase [unclassified Mycolicibacterium]|uniref:SDR family NAD(P)-dependent oxidoreductase n=1 Tax=unclassified Mycolicibacterium TaxID=2636767 RepID=UPI001309F058|nr:MULTISPECIES: SDR family NAD(P)-dependent oxidoreductase [unclassified Mycolicibacterium]MUL85426.1 SDR family NAD(P)-dependent oxidoreductase [Mycolicibacterium sp. CBMA 329]MUL88810.1 SDR family NAD(P)-dependent oxidoreductase [Mycolicibacterium sp. CBMA 331]MUM01916.1 SDR family NAD(P)-dependent oxidoreductase [Mycolicibacterium sp. CBMA 334]MUM24900.1 SDR family NAD(P)-dependent oxidoreductase [Mycolicibacterium sp. CBMA 295]MUM40457.1 SDR family NAD(P)-dependent oxidoreductase [Mycolic